MDEGSKRIYLESAGEEWRKHYNEYIEKMYKEHGVNFGEVQHPIYSKKITIYDRIKSIFKIK